MALYERLTNYIRKRWFYCFLLIELHHSRTTRKFLKIFRTTVFRNNAQQKKNTVFRYTFTEKDQLLPILVSICNKKGKLFKSYNNWVSQIYLKYPYELFLKLQTLTLTEFKWSKKHDTHRCSKKGLYHRIW